MAKRPAASSVPLPGTLGTLPSVLHVTVAAIKTTSILFYCSFKQLSVVMLTVNAVVFMRLSLPVAQTSEEEEERSLEHQPPSLLSSRQPNY